MQELLKSKLSVKKLEFVTLLISDEAFLDFLGASWTCAIIVFSQSGFGHYLKIGKRFLLKK